jgi:hypothetical protein
MQFLANRARLVSTWRYVGIVLLVGLVGLGLVLFWFVPLLANPFMVMARLNGDSIPSSTMALSTALLPITFLTCMLLALAIVLFVFAAFSNERKYLAIVRKMTQSTPGAIKSAQESTAQEDAPADAAEPRPLSFSSGYGP